MADPVDIANENDFSQEKLRLHQNKPHTLINRGRCLNCKEPVFPTEPDGPIGLYCDEGCREDYERLEMIRAKTGRIISRVITR